MTRSQRLYPDLKHLIAIVCHFEFHILFFCDCCCSCIDVLALLFLTLQNSIVCIINILFLTNIMKRQTFQAILVLTFIEYVLSTRPLLFNMTKILLESCNTHLLTPDRKSTTDQTTDTIKAHLGEPMSFIGVTRVQLMGYLQQQK